MKYSLREGRTYNTHWFIEKVILFKLSFFKNNPKANFLLFRSLYITCLISSPVVFCLICDLFTRSAINFFLFRIDLSAFDNFLLNKEKYAVLFTTALGVIYWKLKEEFLNKWKYLMDITVKINELELDKKQSEVSLINVVKSNNCCSKIRVFWNLKFCLIMDSIHLDLWMHKSFKNLYIALVEKCIEINYENNIIWKNKMLKKFQTGKLTQKQVYTLLENVYKKI